MQKYHKAPLPFLGQKRHFIKLIRQMDFTGKTVVDLFGGSGLVSHTIKQQNPTASVIYNDFDNYQSRIDQIEATEQLRQQLLSEAGHLKKSDKITGQLKQHLISIIQTANCTDWITLSSWLLFSGKYAHNLDGLCSMEWYFRVPGAPLCADGYLSGVTRVQKDFRELLAEYRHQDNVIYIDLYRRSTLYYDQSGGVCCQ